MMEFHRRARKPGEDIQVFAYGLETLLSRAIPNIGNDERDTLLKQQFIEGSSPALKRELLQRPSLKYEETVKIAQQLDLTPELSSPNADHNVNLTRVQRENVSSSESTVVRQLKELTEKVNQLSASINNISEVAIRTENPRRGRACYNCGRFNHIANDVDNPSEEMIVEEMTLGNVGTKITALCVVTSDILPVIVNIGIKPHNNDTRETTKGWPAIRPGVSP